MPGVFSFNYAPENPMQSALLSSIIVRENRQRQEFDAVALQELADDIEANGLLHPPVVSPDGDGRYVLRAGESRLRAIKLIFALGGSFRCGDSVFTANAGTLPITSMSGLDELAAEEIELSENIKRRDLTWQELSAAHKRLHILREKQKQRDAAEALVEAGHSLEDAQQIARNTVKQSVRDTAIEVRGRGDGDYQDVTRKELIVADYLDNPAVAGAKDVKEAFKILVKQQENLKLQKLAAEVGATFNADLHHVYNMNCLEWMKNFLAGNPDDSKRFDVIVTDPPYGMGAHEFGDAGGKMTGIEHHYDDSFESWLTLMKGPEGWCALSYKVCAPQAHAYVFCDIDNFPLLRDMMREAGWYVFRTPFTVHKTDSGRVPLPTRGPRRQTEWLLYAIKGAKPVTHIYPDLIPCSADKNTTHGAQKPVALYENLLMRSIKPGDRVADFFGGSGPLLAAAHNLKCSATVVEQNPEYYAICLARLRELKNLETPSPF